MIRIRSIPQALALRGTIPELAIIRARQFMGEGYDPDLHGHIVVLDKSEGLSSIPELGVDALIDDEGLPTYDIIDAHQEGGQIIYEIVFQLDDSRTIAVIAPAETFDVTALTLTASTLKGEEHEDLA